MKAFYWVVGIAVTIFLGGVLVILYNSHQNSPAFDPVTFDLSVRRPDGSSEKNPENIFYVPPRYWLSFPTGLVDFASKYNKGEVDYFSFTTDALNIGESDLNKIKRKISIWVEKYPSWANEYDKITLALNKRNFTQVISSVEIFMPLDEDINSGKETIRYRFKAFDNQIVLGFCNECTPSDEASIINLNIVRKINDSVSIQYNLSTNRISDIYELDRKVVTYLKSLQVPPSSFTRLK